MLSIANYCRDNYQTLSFINSRMSFDTLNSIYYIVTKASFDSLAMGGLMAYIVIYKKVEILNFLFNKYLQLFSYAALLVFVMALYKVPYINSVVVSFLFAVLLLNVSCNPKSLLKLDNKFFDFIADISIGIYAYQSFVFVIIKRLLEKTSLSTIPFNILFFIISLGLTITLAKLSASYYEKWFLSQRKRFNPKGIAPAVAQPIK